MFGFCLPEHKPDNIRDSVLQFCGRPHHATVSCETPGSIGVFHGVAGVARATPGLMELPSTGKGIEVSR